jgi:hypothetical protein
VKRLTCGLRLVEEHHSAKRFSSKAFGKGVCGREYAIIRQKSCFMLGKGVFGNAWWRVLNIKKGQIDDGCDTDIGAGALILGNKSCYRDRLGVMLERGYKYEPLVFVIGIEQFHNKPAPCKLSSPSSQVIEFFERSHRSVDLRKHRQPCIMSSIMRWI